MRRIFWSISCTGVLVVFIVGCFFYWRNSQLAAETNSYALLVAGEGDAASQKVLQGAMAAAKDQTVEVRMYVWKNDVEDQLKRMKETDGMDGVICFLEEERSDSGNGEKIKEICGTIGLPVIIIGQSTDEDEIYTDEKKAGILMAQEALNEGAESIVFLFQKQDMAAACQLEGAKSVLPDGIPYLEAEYEQRFVPDETWKKMTKERSFVLALGNAATEAAIEMKKSGQLEGDVPVIGIGRPMEVESLENGTVSALLYPSYFTLGYRTLEKLHNDMISNGEKIEGQIPYRVITLENLYDSENVSYVFPLLD